MFLSRHSILALIFILFPYTAYAGVANKADTRHTSQAQGGGLLGHAWRYDHQKRQQTCVRDEIYSALSTIAAGKAACAALLHSANATVTSWITPTITVTDFQGTSMQTATNTVRYTAISTTTVKGTTYVKRKREGIVAPAITPAALLTRSEMSVAVEQALQEMEADDPSSYDPAELEAWGPPISSACECLQLGPTFTTTVTLADYTSTFTLAAFVHDLVTINSTTTIATSTVTITVYNITTRTSSSIGFSLTSVSDSHSDVFTTVTTQSSNSAYMTDMTNEESEEHSRAGGRWRNTSHDHRRHQYGYINSWPHGAPPLSTGTSVINGSASTYASTMPTSEASSFGSGTGSHINPSMYRETWNYTVYSTGTGVPSLSHASTFFGWDTEAPGSGSVEKLSSITMPDSSVSSSAVSLVFVSTLPTAYSYPTMGYSSNLPDDSKSTSHSSSSDASLLTTSSGSSILTWSNSTLTGHSTWYATGYPSGYSFNLTDDSRSGDHESSTAHTSTSIPLTSWNASTTSSYSWNSTATGSSSNWPVSGSPPPFDSSSCYGSITVTQTVYTPLSECIYPGMSTFPSNTSASTYPQGLNSSDGTESSSTTISESSLTSSIPLSSASSASLASVYPRQPGVLATDEQIDISCRNVGNQIYNGDFEIVGDFDGVTEPIGWGLVSIGDASVVAVLDPTQHTFGGSYLARFNSTTESSSAKFLQPLTLCPGVTYELTTWTRQLNTLDLCTAVFDVNGQVLGVASPTGSWTNRASNAALYTVGPDDVDASVDFTITLSCVGQGPSSVARLLDIDDLSLKVVL